MLSSRSEVPTRELAPHAYVTRPQLAAGRFQDSLQSVWERSITSVRLGLPKMRNRFDSTRSQFDAEVSISESQVNGLRACRNASATGCVNAASSRRLDVSICCQWEYHRESLNQYWSLSSCRSTWVPPKASSGGHDDLSIYCRWWYHLESRNVYGLLTSCTARGAAPKRHRVGSTTSQFVAEDGTIGSHAISMGACHHAIAPGCLTEPSSWGHDVSICCRLRYHLESRNVYGLLTSGSDRGAAPKRHRVGSASQFVADGMNGSHAISMGACRNATVAGCPTEGSSWWHDDGWICCRWPYQPRLVLDAGLGCVLLHSEHPNSQTIPLRQASNEGASKSLFRREALHLSWLSFSLIFLDTGRCFNMLAFASVADHPVQVERTPQHECHELRWVDEFTQSRDWRRQRGLARVCKALAECAWQKEPWVPTSKGHLIKNAWVCALSDGNSDEWRGTMSASSRQSSLRVRSGVLYSRVGHPKPVSGDPVCGIRFRRHSALQMTLRWGTQLHWHDGRLAYWLSDSRW